MSHQELASDGYIFLDISCPYVAWAAYQGTLITPPNTETQDGRFVSWWLAGLLRNPENLARELALEQVRAQHFSERGGPTDAEEWRLLSGRGVRPDREQESFFKDKL